MSKWEMVRLGDIVDIINGRSHRAVANPKGTYPIYGSGGIIGYADDYICEKNTVVIGRKGTINSPIYVEEPFWNIDTAFGLRPNESRMFPKYLYYFCEKFDFEKINTTVTIPSLTKSNLSKMQIPLPPLSIQQKIADVLDRASALIEKRKTQIEKLDLFAKAKFIEMFNGEQYPLVRLEDICDFITKGTTPPINRITNTITKTSIPYIKVYNLSDNGELHFYEEPQYIDIETHNSLLARSKVFPEDVLMNIVGLPLGKFALVPNDFAEWNINQAVAIFRSMGKVLPIYLMYAMMKPDVLRPFLDKAVGIRQVNLSLKQCRELEIPLPPLELQSRFVDFAYAINKSRLGLQCGLDELEMFFKSLVQRCFKETK